jgi:hypothetical protein
MVIVGESVHRFGSGGDGDNGVHNEGTKRRRRTEKMFVGYSLEEQKRFFFDVPVLSVSSF